MLSLEGEANGVAFEESQLSLLRAVQRLDVGLPVAVDFVSRGIEQKKIHLLVHRVIFHRQEYN